MIFDFNAFHVLSADVEDTVYLWIEKCCRIVVGYGLYLAFIELECCFDQRLTVSGRAGVDNVCVRRELFIDLLDRADRSSQRAAVVIAVK